MTVVTTRRFSPAITRVKSCNVVLPPGYRETGSHAVLYLLHGYGGNRNTWLTATRLVEHALRHDMVVVLPESGRYWFINDHHGRRYEDYLIGEVLPDVERTFAVGRDREYRAIGGFSMGGAAAVFQALRHPDLFCAATSHSGAFHAARRIGDPYAEHRGDPGCVLPSVAAHDRVWGPPGSRTRHHYDPDTVLAGYDGTHPVAIRLDVGDRDYQRMIAMNRSMSDALNRAGIAHEYHESGGGHDWAYVDDALPAALSFLDDHLPRTERPSTKERV